MASVTRPGLVMIEGPCVISTSPVASYTITCVCFYCGGPRRSERTCPACGGSRIKGGPGGTREQGGGAGGGMARRHYW